MQHEPRLFQPLPSHLYCAMHWTPEGWAFTLSASTPLVGGAELTSATYDHLSSQELVDAVSAALAAAMGL